MCLVSLLIDLNVMFCLNFLTNLFHFIREYFFINTFLYKISKFGVDDPLESPFSSGVFQKPQVDFEKGDTDSSDKFENEKAASGKMKDETVSA